MTKKTIQCDKKLTFQECELAILRASVDLAQEKIAKRVVNSPEIQEIINIVRDFIKKKDLIAYGGQAINEELPGKDQFYDKEIDLPDYDFFSPDALDDAKELADLFFSKGFTEVEAKAGQHHGTYKVFVNYMPFADITYIHKELFRTLKKDAVRVEGILYAPPNYLRMSMFLELSRPAGDTDRWEKVLKRLSLLNQYYPLTHSRCDHVEFQRKMEEEYKSKETEIYQTVKNALIDQDVVFFGGYALSNYLRYMPKKEQEQIKKIADFDVIVKDPDTTAGIVKNRLRDIGIKQVSIKKRPAIGEIVPEQTEIKIGGDIIAVLYPPVACHSYNTIVIKGRKVKIATIDTMLSFYLAFLYANKPYYNVDRIVCMAKFLFDVQQKNRLEQKGLLRRFTVTCYGHQDTVEEMRAQKAKVYNDLKKDKNSKEYEEWFLSYTPTSSLSSSSSSSSSSSYKERTKTNIKKTVHKRRTVQKTKTRTKKQKRKPKPKRFDPYNS
jgi:hypothetical protein